MTGRSLGPMLTRQCATCTSCTGADVRPGGQGRGPALPGWAGPRALRGTGLGRVGMGQAGQGWAGQGSAGLGSAWLGRALVRVHAPPCAHMCLRAPVHIN
eukprot:173368-Chlamydomonas_euryale.AAC.1